MKSREHRTPVFVVNQMIQTTVYITCKLGGYIILRHNTVRNTIAELLSNVCTDVVIEPSLLPLTGEQLPRGSNTSNKARLDVSCRGFWTPLDKTFMDIRVFNPNALSNVNKNIIAMYHSHVREKKTHYNQRVINIEHGTFTVYTNGVFDFGRRCCRM